MSRRPQRMQGSTIKPKRDSRKEAQENKAKNESVDDLQAELAKVKVSPASPKGTITNQAKETPVRTTASSKVSTTSAHEKKEFSKADLRANFILPPKPFRTEQQVTAECATWKNEGNTYRSIVTELGRILLNPDKALDADLSDDEARQLFPHDLQRAHQLTSSAFTKSITKIAANNEVEWLAELHHPIQQSFKHFLDPDNEPITAASFGNAVVAQTTETDARLKPDRVFGWSEVLCEPVDNLWVGTIQIPFLVIESKPASAQYRIGDVYKKYILEAKAYEHQDACIASYEKDPGYGATICLPLVFGMYFVGSKVTFDIYRVINYVKKPLTFKATDYATHPCRVLRAIIAIKGWARQIRDNFAEIDEKFPFALWPSDPNQEDFAEKEHDDDAQDDEEPDPRDLDYEDKEGEDSEPCDHQGPQNEIHLHESSKSRVVAKFVEESGHYVVLKTTDLDDGIREAELLRTKLKSLVFVPRLLDLVVKGNKATLKISWHRGRYPRNFRSHRELQNFIRALLENVNSLHNRGIVHNDLKESNLLWDSKSLTIVDFGGADEYPSLSGVYTRGYRAPESLRTPASDVYSCGVVLFNLLLCIQIVSADQVTYLRRCNSLKDVEARIAPYFHLAQQFVGVGQEND